MKTKLIELINHCTSCEECRDEDIADHLLDNGVILPPVRYGQTVYAICDLDDEITIEEYSVDGIGYFKMLFTYIIAESGLRLAVIFVFSRKSKPRRLWKGATDGTT